MITKYPFELQGLMNPQSFVMNPFTKDKYKNELETLKILLQLQKFVDWKPLHILLPP